MACTSLLMTNAKEWCSIPPLVFFQIQPCRGQACRQATAFAETPGAGQPSRTASCTVQFHHHEYSPMMVSFRAIVTAVTAGAVGRRRGRCGSRRSSCRSRCPRRAVAEGETGNVSTSNGVGAEGIQTLPTLPRPEQCWALVTGATTPTGCNLARLCCQQGFGLVIVDYERCQSELDGLAVELRDIQTRLGWRQRVLTVASDLETSSDLETLHANVKSLAMILGY